MERSIIDEVTKNIIEMVKSVARMENKLEDNDKNIQEILTKMDKLCIHVNEEIETMNKRVRKLEDSGLQFKAIWKLVASLGGITGLLSIVTLLLKWIGVIT